MKTFVVDLKERLSINYANLKTILLDAERTKQPVTFYTRTRHYIDNFTCIDYENKPFTLKYFVTHGGLVYYKKNEFEWNNISLDDILKIEVLEG